MGMAYQARILYVPTCFTLSTFQNKMARAKRLWVALFAILTITFMLYLLREHRLELGALRLTNPGLLLFAAGVHGVFWFVAIVFWRYAVRITTHTTLSLAESLRQLALVAVGKYIPGKVWGFFARGAALKQSTSTTTTGVLAATFVEQWAMLMSAGLIGGILLLVLRPNQLLTAMGLAAVITSLFGNHLFRLGNSAIQRVLSIFAVSKVHAQPTSLSWQQYMVLLLTHSLMWTLLGIVLASVYFAFSPHPLSIELSAAIVLANTVGIVVGFAALFAPGGIGVREAMTTVILLPYMPIEQASMLSIAFRLWTTTVDILLGLALLSLSARPVSHNDS